MIVAEDLTKRFGGRTAIEQVAFTVAAGEVTGFLGPNGAGKTTTLRILAGVFPPTAGRAVIDGCDLALDPRGARARLGYAPERPALHVEMTVHAMLAFVATMRGLDAAAARRAADRAIERTGLRDVRARRIGALSRGYRQRVGLAVAIAGDPPALLLDEPLAGLDPAQAVEMRELIGTLAAEGHAVLVSSHALTDVEAMAHRVVILFRGRVLAADRPATLAAHLRRTHRVEVEVDAPIADVLAALRTVPGIVAAEPLHHPTATARCRVESAPEVDVRPAIAATIAARGWPLLALTPLEPSLEEAFLRLTAATGEPARETAPA